MRKILITMIAIAFSLSAYSEITLLETRYGISAYCVNGYVFISSDGGGLVQMTTTHRGVNQSIKGLTVCAEYKSLMRR